MFEIYLIYTSAVEPLGTGDSNTDHVETSGSTDTQVGNIQSNLGIRWHIDENDPRAIRLAARHSRQTHESNVTEDASKEVSKNFFKLNDFAVDQQEKWQAAMQREIQNLKNLQTYIYNKVYFEQDKNRLNYST